MRTCKDCKEHKPLEEFYFRKDSNTYRHKCKKCTIISNSRAPNKSINDRKSYYKRRDAIRESQAHYHKENYQRLSAKASIRSAIRRGGSLCSCCKYLEILNYYMSRNGRDVDHIIPIKDGGLTCLHNLQHLTKKDHILKTKEELRK